MANGLIGFITIVIMFIGIIIFMGIALVSTVNYFDNIYVEKHNKCISDCDRAGQEFFDYQMKLFETECYCLLDNNVNGIW